MIALLYDLIKSYIEVFMGDFSILSLAFEHYLKNIDIIFKRCEEKNLVLNGEKCHFMVREDIILGHKILES